MRPLDPMRIKQSHMPFQLQAYRAGSWVLLSQHFTIGAAQKKIRIWKSSGRPEEELRIIERGQDDFITGAPMMPRRAVEQ